MSVSRPDYSLYLVTDQKLANGRPLVEIVSAAVKGGVTCVQLREKRSSTRTFLQQGLEIKQILGDAGIPLIINDRVDIALAIEADGVHLGQSDMPIADARRLVGPEMIIGVSAESVQDAVQAEAEGADYIGISPVFSTKTKSDHALPLGLEGVSQIRKRVKIPLVGIGGIRSDNAMDVLTAGADGIAVVSAIISANDPKKAAQDLRRLTAQQV